MRHPALRFCFVFLWSVWFGLIIPGHERGFVRLPGAPQSFASAERTGPTFRVNSECCSRTGQPTPTSDPVRHCAICKIVATLDVPLAINHDVAPLGLLPQRAVIVPQSAPHRIALTTQRGRAPPIIPII